MSTTRREALAAAAGGFVSACSQAPREFRYTNPISSGIHPEGIRDSQIFRDNGRWYLTGTSAPFWRGPSPGVRLYSSDNLLHWHHEGLVLERQKMAPDVWHYDRFWAPEIHHLGGRYYLCFNCRNEKLEKPHSTFVATADDVRGPYEVITKDPPLHRGNDLTLFEDDDGKVYGFFNHSKEFGIGGAEFDLDTCRLKQEPVSAIRVSESEWDKIGIEGAYIIKRAGTYYLFYSSWTRGYEIGYATADNILGPWAKHPGNPIYGAQNRTSCERNGIGFTGDPSSPWRAVGHNEVFQGPDGRLWLSCHGILKTDPRPMLVIDPIDFDADGTMRIAGPTSTEQVVTLAS